MRSVYLRSLCWGLAGATIAPVIIIAIGYFLAAMAMAVALACVIGFPVAAIFFPRRLLDTVTPTDSDRKTAREMEGRWKRTSRT